MKKGKQNAENGGSFEVCLTFAFVGVPGGGAAPGPVEVEGLAALAVAARRVVLAVAGELHDAAGRRLAALHRDAARRVPVALAAPAHREVRHGVVLAARSRLLLVVHLVPFVHHVQAVEYDAHVGGRHPVLQHRGDVEVGGAGAPLQRAESEARAPRAVPRQAVAVRAARLLLVGGGDAGLVGPPVHAPALTRVELERLPGHPVVRTLVDRHGVRSSGLRTELQADVGQFILLAERQRQ